MESNKPEPRWTRRKDARPQELLDAALNMFVEKGYAATKLDEVAKQAGVSKGTVYLYFANKEELFKAVVQNHIVTALDNIEEAANIHRGSVSDLLSKLIKIWWNNVGATRSSAIAKVIIAEAGNFPEIAKFYHEEVIFRGENMTMQIIQRGIDAGEFRRVDTRTISHLIMSPFLFLCIWKYSFSQYASQSPDPSEVIEAHIEMILKGLSNQTEEDHE